MAFHLVVAFPDSDAGYGPPRLQLISNKIYYKYIKSLGIRTIFKYYVQLYIFEGNTVKRLILIPIALFSLTSMPAFAEMDMPMGMHMDSKNNTQSHEGKGKINSIDAKAGKINLTHEPIASLDWPAMTMDFNVLDKTALTNLKPGQKVAFKLTEAHKGRYVISEIAAVK